MLHCMYIHLTCRRLEDRRQRDAQAKAVKHQCVDVRLKEAQAKVAKRDSESVQAKEDRRQRDAHAKALKRQSVDIRLKEVEEPEN